MIILYQLKGIWRCTACDNIEAREREVRCWECGKGQMVYTEREKVAAALRPTASVVSLTAKADRNARVSERYDELMREGKHGHYETMFRVVREEVERATSALSP